jgi:hypothetical protein
LWTNSNKKTVKNDFIGRRLLVVETLLSIFSINAHKKLSESEMDPYIYYLSCMSMKVQNFVEYF